MGRDHLARLLYAGQISLSIGLSAAFLSFTIGISFGVITGYYGSAVDDLVNWVMVTLNAIPGFICCSSFGRYWIRARSPSSLC